MNCWIVYVAVQDPSESDRKTVFYSSFSPFVPHGSPVGSPDGHIVISIVTLGGGGGRLEQRPWPR